MSVKPAKAIEVFFSYSHKDEELRDQLEKHLSILKRQGVITGWHDRRIGAGREWEGEIDKHLNTADVILLLISADFLASDYCYDVEMKRAMERHEAGETRVIPVILRPVDWKGAPFGKLQALPKDAKPVTSWPNRDEAFTDVAQGIRAAVEELAGPSLRPSSPADTAPVGQKKVPVLPSPAQPRQPVNWKRWGFIAGVIGLLIAFGAWLVPNASDFLSAPLFETPAMTPTSSPTGIPVISVVTEVVTATPGPPTPTPEPEAGATMVWEDGSVMVYVPAGEFTMGSSDGEVDYALQLCNEYYGDCERSLFEDEQPQHKVYLDAFWIDKTEVTNVQYQRCVEARVCPAPTMCDWGEPPYGDASKAEHPVVCVSWHDAKAYCEWAGKRLPTEAEWEKAARGTDGWIYPWGNAFDGGKLNSCDVNCSYDWKDASANDDYAETAPAGSYPTGASPYGALNMAGNAWEWVADGYDPGYYNQSPYRNPLGPDSGEERVLRGGSWYIAGVRIADRHWCHSWLRHYDMGSRCAMDSE